MKRSCAKRNDGCVILEIVPGGYLGYGRARLLTEIERYHSLSEAASFADITLDHARFLVRKINTDFRADLIIFAENEKNGDRVYLSPGGKKDIESVLEEVCSHLGGNHRRTAKALLIVLSF